MAEYTAEFTLEEIRAFCDSTGRPTKRGVAWLDADGDLVHKELARGEVVPFHAIEVVLSDSGQGFDIAFPQFAEKALGITSQDAPPADLAAKNEEISRFRRILTKEFAGLRSFDQDIAKKIVDSQLSENDRGQLAGLRMKLGNAAIAYRKFNECFENAHSLLCRNVLVNPVKESVLWQVVMAAFTLARHADQAHALEANRMLLKVRGQQNKGKRPTEKLKIVAAVISALGKEGNRVPTGKDVASALDGKRLEKSRKRIRYNVKRETLDWGDGNRPSTMRSLRLLIAKAK